MTDPAFTAVDGGRSMYIWCHRHSRHILRTRWDAHLAEKHHPNTPRPVPAVPPTHSGGDGIPPVPAGGSNPEDGKAAE